MLGNEDKNNTYYLRLGIIDDADESYLNGHLIGFAGSFPPNYSTAAFSQREYFIPSEFLNFNGENVIAIRVYDGYGFGGIKNGRVELCQEISGLIFKVNLSGLWKFNPGDNPDWKDPKFNDKNWNKITAPAVWQTQGYKDLLGFAWYRKEFKLDKKYKNERLILIAGVIDDIDETYLNGHLIGRTGTIYDDPSKIRINSTDHVTLRAYYIPNNVLSENGKNLIAIRVYDGLTYGGIKTGPVGIVTRDQYLEWKNYDSKRKAKNIFDYIFGN